MGNLTVIPGYDRLKQIGSGGISQVYSAYQKSSEKKVAIKILDPKLLKEDSLARRFRQEAETISKLNHPNILSIYEVGQANGLYYLVMEFLPITLSERIHSPKEVISQKEILYIIRKIAGALQFAHDKGIIHRDIKSENIMFREDKTPVLVDFGLAKIVDSLESLTKSGLTVGTPEYMSPELIQGLAIDGRTDIYSLGVVLYEMLAKKVPYRARHYVSLAMKHIKKKIPKLPRKARHFQPVLNKMMAKNRGNRVSNVRELISILDHLDE